MSQYVSIKTILVINCIFFYTYVSFAQVEGKLTNAKMHRTYNQLTLANAPSIAQIDSIIDFINIFSQTSLDTSQLLIDHLSDIIKNQSPLQQSAYNYEKANILMLVGNHTESTKLLQDIISTANNDISIQASALQLLGNNYEKTGEFELAIEYYLKAVNTLIEEKDNIRIAKLYLNISDVFFNINQLTKSSEYNDKVLEISKKFENLNLQVNAIGMKATLSMTYGIQYYLQNERDTANINNTIDTLNHYFEKAALEFEAGLDLSKNIEDKRIKLSLLNNYVALNLNMENYEKAEKLSLEAIKTADAIGAVDLIIQSRLNLGSYYRRTGQLDLALKYAQECLDLSKKHNLERKEYLSYSHLFQANADIGDWEKAVIAQDYMRSYETKIAETDRTEALANAENKFQAALKEKENLLLKTQNDKIVRQRNTAIGGGILSSIFLFLLYRLNKARKEKNDKIEFTKAILFTQEEERKSIARDLHDGVGQSLLLIKKQIDTNQKTNLENSNQIAQTLEEIRSISRGLHPFQLEKFGLTNTLKDTVESINKSTDIFITSHLDDIDGLLLPKSEIHIYRIVQEALNNIIKHSEATAAKINVTRNNDNIRLTLQDNGKGFDPELTISKSKSLGLKTMNERVRTIGGKLSFSKNDNGKGTQIRINIPF